MVLTLTGRDFPLYFHYLLWPGILDAIKAMGFQTICTYKPPRERA